MLVDYLGLLGINVGGAVMVMLTLFLVYRRGTALRVGFLICVCIVITTFAVLTWAIGDRSLIRGITVLSVGGPLVAIILALLFRQIVAPVRVLTRSLEQIAKGEMPPKITHAFKDEFNDSKESLNRVIDTMNHLLQETDDLSLAVQHGKLATRGNAEAFDGRWHDLVKGINQVVEAFVAPITVTAHSLHQLAQGEIPENIHEEYQGDFNTIKENLNGLIDATHDITQLAEELADGNLSVDVRERSEQDVLMQALNVMVQQVREVVRAMQSTAKHVTDTSKELSTNSVHMSQGAAEQAASTEEASASLEEMATSIKQTAENSKRAETMAKQMADDASEGGRAVMQTAEAMKEVVEKIAIVQEIAMETRMLSLNATIEASRASEHGKAFSTVAAEVRQLADTTKTAAGDIRQLSHASVEVAERSGNLLGQIVPNSQKTADFVQEVSAANSEQSTGVEQINHAIQQLDQLTQQHAAMTEETARMSEELATQATLLQDAIEFFTFDDEEDDDAFEFTDESEYSTQTSAEAVSRSRHRKKRARPTKTRRRPKRAGHFPKDDTAIKRKDTKLREEPEAPEDSDTSEEWEDLHDREFERF